MPTVDLSDEEWNMVVTILAHSNPLIAKIIKQLNVQQQVLRSTEEHNAGKGNSFDRPQGNA